jgi:hypothetical protein
MKRHWWLLAAFVTTAAVGQEPSEPVTEADFTKRRLVERPTEELVAELSPAEEQAAAPAPHARPAPADRTKRLVVEPAVEAVVRGTQPLSVKAAAEPGGAAADDNPRVEPGKVKWHGDVAAAIAAAKASGKPLLVFHLLGQLDQRFT